MISAERSRLRAGASVSARPAMNESTGIPAVAGILPPGAVEATNTFPIEGTSFSITSATSAAEAPAAIASAAASTQIPTPKLAVPVSTTVTGSGASRAAISAAPTVPEI